MSVYQEEGMSRKARPAIPWQPPVDHACLPGFTAQNAATAHFDRFMAGWPGGLRLSACSSIGLDNRRRADLLFASCLYTAVPRIVLGTLLCSPSRHMAKRLCSTTRVPLCFWIGLDASPVSNAWHAWSRRYMRLCTAVPCTGRHTACQVSQRIVTIYRKTVLTVKDHAYILFESTP